jgi:hypothetical protein
MRIMIVLLSNSHDCDETELGGRWLSRIGSVGEPEIKTSLKNIPQSALSEVCFLDGAPP